MSAKAIIFDLGGVLIQYDEAPEHAAVQAMCADAAYAKARIPQLIPWDRLNRGQFTFDDLFNLLVKEVGLGADYSTFVSAAALGFGPPMPGIDQVIEMLAGRFQLALLSNTNAVHWGYAKTTYGDLLDKVRPHFVSFDLSMMKPEPDIYRHVAEALAVLPEDCLLIDDLSANIDGARSVGFDAIHFQNAEQLALELTARSLV